MDENKFENQGDSREDQNRDDVPANDNLENPRHSEPENKAVLREIGAEEGDSAKTRGKDPYKWKIGVILAGLVLVAGITYATVYNNQARNKYGTSGLPESIPKTNNANIPSVSSPAPAKGVPSTGNVAKAPPTIVPNARQAAKAKLTMQDAQKIMTEVATKKYGNNPVVIPADNEAREININGINRLCYLYAAGKTGATEFKGGFYVDAVTGEVFDDTEGQMKKIR